MMRTEKLRTLQGLFPPLKRFHIPVFSKLSKDPTSNKGAKEEWAIIFN